MKKDSSVRFEKRFLKKQKRLFDPDADGKNARKAPFCPVYRERPEKHKSTGRFLCSWKMILMKNWKMRKPQRCCFEKRLRLRTAGFQLEPLKTLFCRLGGSFERKKGVFSKTCLSQNLPKNDARARETKRACRKSKKNISEGRFFPSDAQLRLPLPGTKGCFEGLSG